MTSCRFFNDLKINLDIVSIFLSTEFVLSVIHRWMEFRKCVKGRCSTTCVFINLIIIRITKSKFEFCIKTALMKMNYTSLFSLRDTLPIQNRWQSNKLMKSSMFYLECHVNNILSLINPTKLVTPNVTYSVFIKSVAVYLSLSIMHESNMTCFCQMTLNTPSSRKWEHVFFMRKINKSLRCKMADFVISKNHL